MRTILSFLLIYSLSWACSAEFTAQVDRSTISINETLTLTLSTDEQVDSRSVEFSSLTSDFEILGTSPQSSLSIVNGRQSALTRWVVTLLPKTTGQLTIPAFSLNGETTSPINVEVTEVSQRVGDSPITAQLEVNNPTIYVNEELIVTISLISSPEVSSLSGEQLNIDSADVTLLDQQSFSRLIDGENWQVNQWRYAVYRRSEGPLHIPAQTFSGVVGSPRSPFDRFSVSGRRILARTQPLDVNVEAAPTDEQNWLPARDVSLEVVWSGNPDTLEVGEPMTRTIVTSAIGQQAAALPPLATDASSRYKVYADQPEINDQPTSTTLRSERRDSAAVVPSEPGQITFPEIRVPWWDIESETWQETLLPAETIQVTAASVAPLSAPEALSAPQPQESEEPQATQEGAVIENSSTSDSLWKWAAGVLMALSLFLAIENLRLRQRPGKVSATLVEAKRTPDKQLWQALTQAIRHSNPMAIRANLLAWADQKWPEQAPHTLHKLRENGNELEEHLRELEAACSGSPAANLQPEAFLQALLSWQRTLETGDADKKGTLPDLYPARSGSRLQ